ncbi:MAG: hypothetical protein UFA98_06830 [Ruminococcus sp.]|nr:hypothetical protein [Ruminococcus sp.]
MQTDGKVQTVFLSKTKPLTAACVHTTHTAGAEGHSNAAETNRADFDKNDIELNIAVDDHFTYLLF